jgi:TonB-linked SusC/RagA family outer membrane protein
MLLTAFGKKACPGLVANSKTRRMNKHYFLTLLVLLVQIGQTQAQRITLNVNNVSLDTVFAKIQEQTPYRFVYTSEELAGTKKVSFSVQKAPINTVLSLSFKDQPLDYSIEDPYIYVRKKEKTEKTPPSQNQTTEIRGKITNEQGDPLEGGTVQINQLAIRTITNAKGEFLFRNIAIGNYELEITFIGYETYTTTAKADPNGPQLTITMKRSISNLDETVIKGYYTTTKRFNTGDVTTVTGEDIQKQPVSDPIVALEGRVPGLYISQTSGVPGAEISAIQLRGRNSISNGTNPLFIVDGVPFTSTSLTDLSMGAAAFQSPFNSINPSDIENIEVLKDADATAIYGSRGANGVILITTKKGKAGQTKYNINVFSGAGKVTRTMDLLNTQQYLQMRHEAFNNDGASPGPSDYDINGTWDTTRYTNWQKEFIGGTSQLTRAQASISGGIASTQFIVGGGYSRQTTVFPGNFADQIGSMHFNLTHASSNQKFHSSFSASYANDNNLLPTSDLTGNITLAPDAPAIYDVAGNVNWQNNTWFNPFGSLLQKSNPITTNLTGNLILSYELFPGLQIKGNFGYNTIELNQSITSPLSSYPPAYASYTTLRTNRFSTNRIKTWITEPQVNYKKRLGEGQLEALVGTTFQQNTQSLLTQQASDFTSDALINDIAAAANIFVLNYNYTQYRYNAIFGRVGYNWQEKYILNLTARRDGSSRFGPGNQFGNFGSAGAGWIFSKEQFVQRALTFLSFGKLRASYGSTGNDQIGDYQYLSTYTAYNYPYQGISGLYPTQLTNPNYKWELVKKLELGLELGFLKDRVFAAFNYYRNRTDNQLVGYSLPAITGFSSVTANLPALIQNAGFEAQLNTTNIKGNVLTWTSSFNISVPRNKLLAYPDLEGSSYANQYVVGKSLFIKPLYHYTGVNPQTGVYTFATKNANGIPSYPEDLQPTKQIAQNYFGGFQNSFTYKGWQLDILFQFVKQTSYNYFNSFNPPGYVNSNQPTLVLQRWRKSGDIGNIEQFTQNTNSAAGQAWGNAVDYSDYIISDASFIRLKNLAVSYQLPGKWRQKADLQNARIYLQCQNLFTITKYQGMDPEIAASGTLLLPPIRMITAGIQLIF